MFDPDPDYLSVSSTNFGGHQATFDSASQGQGSSMDGFGSFNVQAANSAGTGGVSSPVAFALGDIVANFPDNALGNEFVVHVRFEGFNDVSCSGWVGGVDGSNSRTGIPGSCAPQIPEPGTLTLLGTGLIGLASVVRRRLSR